MKIIIVGGTGTIGCAVAKELSERHDVVIAGLTAGRVQVDIEKIETIKNMYETVGPFDALVATTGQVFFGALEKISTEDFNLGLHNKLMGQVNLVMEGLKHINDNGSFTLTSGLLNHDPIRTGACAAMVNGAIDGFVKGAAIEMPRSIRINAVSPTVITESLEKYAPYFRGFVPVDASQAALAYSKSVEGLQTGQVYCAGW